MPRLGGRKRPRVKSYRLRGLWWVVLREAALRICVGEMMSPAADAPLRRLFAASHTSDIRRHVNRSLLRDPARRVWPRVGAPR